MAALAVSTLAGYEVFIKRYELFMAATGLPRSAAWPPSSSTIMAFVSWLCTSHQPARGGRYSYGNIQKALCALKAACKFAGMRLQSFETPRLELFMRGVRKTIGDARREPRLPLVFALVAMICDAWTGSNMGRALFLVAFFGLFRPGEITKAPGSTLLPRANVEWLSGHVKIRLDASKVDIFRRGAHAIIAEAAPSFGKYCPVKALRKAWDEAKDKRPMAALFQTQEGKTMTYESFRRLLKQAIMQAKLEGKFSPHSFRIGGATELAMQKVPPHVIKAMGRWSSDCYQRYVRLPAEFVKEVSRGMATRPTTKPEGGVSPSVYGGLPLTVLEKASFEEIAFNVHG